MNDTGFTLPPKFYDFLKWIALVVLPLAAALVITVGTLLHWDGSIVTAGVLTAVDTFLGGLLGKSSSNYKQAATGSDGDLVLGQEPDGTPYMKTVRINTEDPIFNVGTQMRLNIVREVDPPKA